jgi:uncharacterized C2H2 Zn-finger protein
MGLFMSIADTIKSIVSKPVEKLQRKREIKKERVEEYQKEYHRARRLRCPECGEIFNSQADYERHWNKEHRVFTAMKPVIAGTIKGVETAKKASAAARGRFKKGPLPSGRSDVICPNCGTSYPFNDKFCPECGEKNYYQSREYKAESDRERKKLSKSARERVDSEIYVVIMFVLAGIAALFVPPLLGFPYQLIYLAAALMGIMPIYILLPDEADIINSLGWKKFKTDRVDEEGRKLGYDYELVKMGAKGWLLVPKALFKILFFVLVIYQFFLINMLITLVIAFIFYFSLDIEFRNSEPYKMIESFFRMALGAFIAYLFYVTFGTISVGLSLAAMAVAFFATLPVYKKEKSEAKWKISVEITDKFKTAGGYFDKIDRFAWFPFWMLLSLITSGVLFWTGDITQIMFILIWLVSLIAGMSSGSGGRPALGVLMVIVALFAFSSAYTGQIGQAVFGYYWPQVQSFSEMVLGPLGDMWSQAQSGMSDAWLMLTSPQQYYLMQQQKQQATKSKITSGGTSKSIELSRFDLSPSIPGILEPSEPVIGNMEIQNGGDFVSGKIALDIEAVGVDASLGEEFTAGSISNLYCSNADIVRGGNPAHCTWTGDTYPKELRAATFKLQEGSVWDDGIYNIYSSCMNNEVDPPTPCTCFSQCPPPAGNTTYEYSGTIVKVNSNLTYNYVVNVSMPVTIISSDKYLQKLQAQEITLQDLTSEYTGGPVKATLFTQKQPARTDIPFLVVASIYNDGAGELKNITDFIITIYRGDASNPIVGNVEIIGTTFRRSAPSSGASPDGCDGVSRDSDNNFVITCHNTWGTIEQGEFKRVSFYIYPDETNVDDEMATLIVGWANYNYLKQKSLTLTVANAPPQ